MEKCAHLCGCQRSVPIGTTSLHEQVCPLRYQPILPAVKEVPALLLQWAKGTPTVPWSTWQGVYNAALAVNKQSLGSSTARPDVTILMNALRGETPRLLKATTPFTDETAESCVAFWDHLVAAREALTNFAPLEMTRSAECVACDTDALADEMRGLALLLNVQTKSDIEQLKAFDGELQRLKNAGQDDQVQEITAIYNYKIKQMQQNGSKRETDQFTSATHLLSDGDLLRIGEWLLVQSRGHPHLLCSLFLAVRADLIRSCARLALR